MDVLKSLPRVGEKTATSIPGHFLSQYMPVHFIFVFGSKNNLRQVLARGLQHLITFELVDYRDFAKQHPGEFDRIISCEMVRQTDRLYQTPLSSC